MVGFMNDEALRKTRETGFATFFSRTRGKLWTKGETSGNRLEVTRILVDCDDDTVLIKVNALGDGLRAIPGRGRVFSGVGLLVEARDSGLGLGVRELGWLRALGLHSSVRAGPTPTRRPRLRRGCHVCRAFDAAIESSNRPEAGRAQRAALGGGAPSATKKQTDEEVRLGIPERLPAGRDDSAVRARRVQHLRVDALVLSGHRRPGDRVHADSARRRWRATWPTACSMRA